MTQALLIRETPAKLILAYIKVSFGMLGRWLVTNFQVLLDILTRRLLQF